MKDSEECHERLNIWDATRCNNLDGIIDLISDTGGVDVNERNDVGETPLHIAAALGLDTVVGVLLESGANPNLADWESHWTPLHRALYFGHLKASLLLLKHGAYLGDEELHGYISNKQDKNGRKVVNSAVAGDFEGTVPFVFSGVGSMDRYSAGGHKKLDRDGQSPLDLLSLHLKTELKMAAEAGKGGDVWAFGKADFQLGFPVPNALVVERPRRVGTLGLHQVVAVCASRHHTVALSKMGKVFTWGHGRGGRLGHGDENPRMTPTLVVSITHKRMVAIAAAENHTCCVRQDGVVYSWGSDRFGQLGHSANPPNGCKLDPKKVEALRRCKVVSLSAGAAHTVALTEEGEVYSWGSNKAGQLGIPHREKGGKTGGAASGAGPCFGLPRRIDALLGLGRSNSNCKALQVSAAAQSTVIIMESPGMNKNNKVYEWGHGNPVPSRVYFGSKKDGKANRTNQAQPWSHINIVQVSAARHHNVALSSVGAVYTWGLGAESLGLEPHKPATHSASQPRLVEAMLPSAGGGVAVAVSASEHHTAAVTETGDLYTWGATTDSGVLGHGKGKWQPVAKRVAGIKRAVQVAAAPDHTVVLLASSQPPTCYPTPVELKTSIEVAEEGDFDDLETDLQDVPPVFDQPLTLKQTCEKVVCGLVDLRNAVSVLAHAEAYDAPALTAYCTQFIRRNLDGILVLGRPADMEFLLEDAGECLKELLESHAPKASVNLKRNLSVDSDMGNSQYEEMMDEYMEKARARKLSWGQSLGNDPTPKMVAKAARYTRKKLTQIATLEKMQLAGHSLSPEQLLKLERKAGLETDMKKLQPLLAKFELLDRAALKRSLSVDSFGTAESDTSSCHLFSPRGSVVEPAEEGPGNAKHSDGSAEPAWEEPTLPARRQRSTPLTTCPEKEALTPAELVPGTPPKPKVYRCDLCEITCHDRIMLQQHLKGKKHATRSRQVQEKMQAGAKVPTAPWCTNSLQQQQEQRTALSNCSSETSTPHQETILVSQPEGTPQRGGEREKANSPEVLPLQRASPQPHRHSFSTPSTNKSKHSEWKNSPLAPQPQSKSAPPVHGGKAQSFRSILEAQHVAAGASITRNLSALAAMNSPKQQAPAQQLPPTKGGMWGPPPGVGVAKSPSAPAEALSPNLSLADFMKPKRKNSKEKPERPAWSLPESRAQSNKENPSNKAKSFMEIQLEEEEHQKVEVSGMKDTAWYIHEKRVRSESFDKIIQQQQQEAELQAAMDAIQEMERAEKAKYDAEEAEKKKRKNAAKMKKRNSKGAQRKDSPAKGGKPKKAQNHKNKDSTSKSDPNLNNVSANGEKEKNGKKSDKQKRHRKYSPRKGKKHTETERKAMGMEGNKGNPQDAGCNFQPHPQEVPSHVGAASSVPRRQASRKQRQHTKQFGGLDTSERNPRKQHHNNKINPPSKESKLKLNCSDEAEVQARQDNQTI